MTHQTSLHIGFVIFPGMTQLDLTGPYQVFSLMPNTSVHLLWKDLEPVKSDSGLTILPTTLFQDCPPLDVICVPGGSVGIPPLLQDDEVLVFLQQQAQTAQYVTSVCNGSLVLAAAGLLQGYRAACHWAFRDQLALLGVEVGTQRVVRDRNRITGGGVTAGLDFGLVIASALCGEDMAKTIQLLLEYNPAPPFNAGSPETAGEKIVENVKKLGRPMINACFISVQQIAAKLSLNS